MMRDANPFAPATQAVRDNLDATIANVAVRRAAGDPALVVSLYEKVMTLRVRAPASAVSHAALHMCISARDMCS